MEVGIHCQLSSCNQLSFLPISCSLCQNDFCESHFLPIQHDCPNTPFTSTSNIKEKKKEKQCEKKGCKKQILLLQQEECKGCNHFFCHLHQIWNNHSCIAGQPLTPGQIRLQQIQERKNNAKLVIAKQFPKFTKMKEKSLNP